jgi:DNA repair exonuclease SbcCD ATPase subunit
VANPADGNPPAQGLPGLDRVIIRTITLTLAVLNVQAAYRQVEQIAAEQGGLVANAQLRQDGDRTSATVTIRVPTDPATYQATLERLRALAQRVTEEQDKAQDVTEEYVDLDARLRSLRASETSLLALYQKAERLEDVFAVQRELTTVRGQIEQIEGRRQVLARQAALATITVQLREASALARTDWGLAGDMSAASEALLVVARRLATVGIWLVVWLPLYSLPLLLLRYLLRRQRALPR